VETLKSETQASLTRISTLQQEAEQLTSEIEAARADVVEQREAAAAEAARLDAAHAEALANLNERRREDAAAAEKRLAEADEAHAADAEAIRARAESREKRLSWAFSASKALLAETNAAILADHARMKQRFDARDSRDDDVEKIAELSAEVNALDNLNMHLRRETQAIARELDNRDQNDYIFGNAPGHRSAAGPRKSLGSRTQSVSTGRTIDASSFLTAKGTSVGTRRTVRGQ
jgi:hypothetical protein